jgi:hypothetical protein
MAKSTDAEIQLRLATIYEMVAKGCTRKYIVRYCSENYKISDRQVDEYLSRVYEEIKNTFDSETKELILSKQLIQLEELYMKSFTIEDFRECRNIIETRAKMLGLNAPTKSENINTNIDKTPIFGDLDLDE